MAGKNGQVSRRRPWPYDAYIGTIPVMLKPNDQGNLVGQKTRTLDQSAPTNFEYGSANPFKERTFLWTKLYGGFGEAIAPSGTRPRRYLKAHKADLSINGQWMKGPNFEDHIEEIDAGAGEVRQFVQALHSGTLTLFAICENGVWRRVDDDDWAPSLTIGLGGDSLPSGMFPQQAVRFKARHTGAIDALYLATATGNLWQYDGTSWAEASSAEGPGDAAEQGEARYIEKMGDELWVGGNHWVVKCEDDPMLRTSYSAVIWIGDQTALVTYLKQFENVLTIYKEDGVYTLSAAGLDQELFPEFRARRNVKNGHGASSWLGELWVPFGGQSFRLSPAGALTPDGLEQMLDNRTEIKGRMIGGVGHNTWFFYEVYCDDAGHSYLMKHGSWIDQGAEEGVVGVTFVDSHHGAIADWDKEAVSVDIVSGLHVTGNERLYVGFTDGTIEWCVLPKDSPNPSQDLNCEFTYLDSYVYIPVHHSNFQADNKLFRGISIYGASLTNSEWAEVEYRIDIANPLADWQLLNSDQPRFTVPGMRLEFPTTPAVYSKAIEFRVKLAKDENPAVSPANLTPVIEGISVHEQIRPAISLEYTVVVHCSSHLAKYNGMVDRRRGVDIKDAILNLCAGAGTATFVFADGVEQELTIVDYKENWVQKQGRRDLEYDVVIEAIQLATLTQGTVATGLTYATLEQYTHGELEALL